MRRRTTTRRTSVVAGALALGLSLAACGGGDSGGSSGTTVDYWMWDASQVPGYQRCADAFERANPGTRIRITQYGWDDYWSKITAGFIADTAPDVFVNHVSKFPQFTDLDVLRPLDELGPTRTITDAEFQPGLGQLWKGQDGKRYGAPKDWDTVAVFYDKRKVAAAGITPQQLSTMTWNPTDGGSFQRIVSRLTVDERGRRGDQAGFDKSRVRTYGFASGGGGGDNWGQTQWSPFTGSTGWQPLDQNPWGRTFRFDEPGVQRTIEWYFGLNRKGFMPSYREIGGSEGTSVDKQVQTGQAAMAISGSWMLGTFTSLTDAQGKKLDIGIAPTPVGPNGRRASMFNGIADSITRSSDSPQASAQWVKFLSGDACQQIIGRSGVVFPARPAGTQAAIDYNRTERRIDVSPFTDQVRDRTTFLFPMTSNSADVTALMQPQLDAIYIGSEKVSSLTGLNRQLDDLLALAAK